MLPINGRCLTILLPKSKESCGGDLPTPASMRLSNLVGPIADTPVQPRYRLRERIIAPWPRGWHLYGLPPKPGMKREGVLLQFCYPGISRASVAAYRNIDLVCFRHMARVEDWMRIRMP